MLELSWFVCGILYFLFGYYWFLKFIYREEIKLSFALVISSIIFALLYVFIMNLKVGALQPYFINLIFLGIIEVNRKTNITKAIISILSMFLVLCISELLFDSFIVFALKLNLIELLENSIIFIISNLCIFIIALFISKLKFINIIIYRIVLWQTNNNLKSSIFFTCFAYIILSFVLYNNFLNVLSNSILLFLDFFFVGILVFVIGYFKERANNNKIVSEYEQLLDYVKIYEKTIEEKSKDQHEYKNQLILIKGMLNKNNKKANKYIDDLICDQTDDNNLELLRKLQYLPQGGLKGLIYYKVEEMIAKNIDIYINISPKLNKPRVSKIINDNLHDLSKIVGVYLDNAIEAVSDLEEKYIIIEADVEKNSIIFSFSNTYNGHIDLSRLDKEGYTTKGHGKGYGLSLVKDIINNNKSFEQSREINGLYYVQKLYIKK